MSRINIKYSCIFTLSLMIIYAFLPAFSVVIYPSVASASGKNDIYKGLGIALLLILVSKLGQSQESSTDLDVIKVPEPDNTVFQDKDLELLAKAIHGEARGEPYEGQVAVGAVVLNRVESPEFPNNLRDVIYQENQFSAVTDGQINLLPNDTSRKAARDAINGRDPSLGALFFYNPKKARTLWWLSQRETTIIIGDHVFAK